MSEPGLAENKARRLALVGAPRLPRIGDTPPPMPPPVRGWETFQDLRLRILRAAFGERIHLDVLRAQRNVDRMRRALEKYKADAGVRLKVRPATLLGSVYWSPWDEYARPSASIGLFGRRSYPSPPPLSPDEERKKQKASRAARRIEELEENVSVLLQHLLDANQRAGDFIRSLAIRGALSADTIDAAGNQRPVVTAAWVSARNWQQLLHERQFEAEMGASPGVPCFPSATAGALVAFVDENGASGLSDIDGASRALNGLAQERSHRWKSAAEWFRAEGEAIVRAALKAQGQCTEGGVRREAARRWNAMPDECKAPGRTRVKPDTFKYATRKPKRGRTGRI